MTDLDETRPAPIEELDQRHPNRPDRSGRLGREVAHRLDERYRIAAHIEEMAKRWPDDPHASCLLVACAAEVRGLGIVLA